MKEAFASPCLIVRKPGYMYEHFASSHFKSWNSDMTVSMPMPPSSTLARLDGYADQVRSLLDSVLRKATSTKGGTPASS
jgi:hypothetical protein